MRELFESTIERLLADQVTPELLRACESGTWPATLWAAIEDSGFAVAAAPEALGGADASWDDIVVLVLAAGRHSLPLPLPETLLANALLGRCGLEALNEPLSVSAATVTLASDGRVSGTLTDVPWGRHVGKVVAFTAGAAPQLVLLDAKTARITPRLNVAGEPRDDLQFDATLPLATAPLAEGVHADSLLLGGAMLRSAQMAGALQTVLTLSTRYATERVQFGKPISAFQAIQHQLAVMAEQTACAVVAAEGAFAESDLTPDRAWASLPIASAKVCASEAAGVAAAMGHTVHGAIGFTHEHALQLSTRRLWSWRSEFGNQTYWAQRLGQAVCAGGAAAFWPTVTRGSLDLTTLNSTASA
ncbi:MAG: hypothetical protein RJA98_2315 [Pseudomonadota bacterium]|jgi:acyl-CoA dehydrogenase